MAQKSVGVSEGIGNDSEVGAKALVCALECLHCPGGSQGQINLLVSIDSARK